MTPNQTTESPTDRRSEQVEIIGWHYESYSEYRENWTAVITLDEDRTPATLRDRDGEIRNITPIVRLDEIVPAIEEMAQSEREMSESSTDDGSNSSDGRYERALAAWQAQLTDKQGVADE